MNYISHDVNALRFIERSPDISFAKFISDIKLILATYSILKISVKLCLLGVVLCGLFWTVAAPAKEGNLYILLVASGFSDMSGFQTKAQEARNYLLSKEPFASRSSDVVISIYENTADLGCYTGCYAIDRLMCCDSQKVMAAVVASGRLYDEIVIIHNPTTYSGGGNRDFGAYETDSTYSFCQVYNGLYTAPMTLHEFGHSFGNLCDEYTYGSEGYSYYDCVNCRASCSDWADVSSGCQLGCDARSDYYRPEDSIMISYASPYYNQPSIHKSLIPRLNYFAPATTVTTGSTPVSIFQLLLLE